MRALYSALLRLALPLVLARLWWRGRKEPGYRRFVGERLGRYALPAKAPLVWLHAVSVGEARAAAPLVRSLQQAWPDHGLLLTCTTAAGRDTLEQLYGSTVIASYLPYDYPGAVRRFLAHFRPRLGVIMETEVWPNLVAACQARAIPLVLANARMSEKSARGYERWQRLMRPAFEGFAAVCAQTADDAARLRQLGAAQVEITGNLKFYVQPDHKQLEAGRAWRAALGRPVLLLASTREGEERLLLEALASAPAEVLVLVVPRHPQRFDEVAALAHSRRSKNPLPQASERVHLGDTMGEMAFYFAASDVALIGGSFLPLGGQNLIEGLAVGTPIITGPSMFNFAEATRLAVGAGAAIQCADAPEAAAAALELLGDAPRRAAMSEMGRRFCELHRGATRRHLEALVRVLRTRARG